MRLPLPVALALALPGCAAAAGGTPDAAAPPSLAIVDPATLQPFADGSSAQIIHGPQGGYHVLVTLLARGIWPGTAGVPGSPDDPTTTLHALRDDGSDITLPDGNTNVLHLAWEANGDAFVLRDRQLRLATTMPASLGGTPLTIGATVVDRDGKQAAAERRAVAVAPID